MYSIEIEKNKIPILFFFFFTQDVMYLKLAWNTLVAEDDL